MTSTQGRSDTKRPPRSVLVVDDHPVVREGLRRLLEDSAEFSFAGEAEDGETALLAAADLKPELLLLDLSLPGRSGIDLVESMHLRFPEIPILVVSVLDESLYAERVLRAGALGFLNKTSSGQEVLEALRTVAEGRIHLGEAARDQAIQRIGRSGQPSLKSPIESLTDRELDVFERIGQGQTAREIAATLSLSPKTVETHRDRIRRKLGLASGIELIAYAVRWRESRR